MKIYSLTKYLSNVYDIPDSVLGTENPTMNKILCVCVCPAVQIRDMNERRGE